MRTPNTSCLLCRKPLYRRPSDMEKARYSACMDCRGEAQKVAGITEAQQCGLALARKKGHNYRNGRKDAPETKEKRSRSLKQFFVEHPEVAVARGAKTRGELSRHWKGGASRLNISIRQMTENRKWMDAVKERDGGCVRCGSIENLESHHLIELAELIETHGIKSRDDARAKARILFDVSNGIALCQRCHYAEHGRVYCEAA